MRVWMGNEKRIIYGFLIEIFEYRMTLSLTWPRPVTGTAWVLVALRMAVALVGLGGDAVRHRPLQAHQRQNVRCTARCHSSGGSPVL